MKIDQEFKSLIPALTNDEYKQLEENIIKEGCRDALVTWNDILIDGNNRYEICTKNNIPFKTVVREFESKDAAKQWIILNQLGRRNLSKYDKSILALQYKPVFEAKAKENQLSSLKQNTVLTNLSKRGDKEKTPINTRKEIAKIAGISEGTINKVEKIEKHASPEIIEQVKAGELTINGAYILTISAIETKRKNEENQKNYEESLKIEKQEREEKQRIQELEASLPENAVLLNKFRKPEETHIFGITDFNNLTEEQFNKCLIHAKKYKDAICKMTDLYTELDSLRAWEAVIYDKKELNIWLDSISQVMQKTSTIQNYLKGVKK